MIRCGPLSPLAKIIQSTGLVLLAAVLAVANLPGCAIVAQTMQAIPATKEARYKNLAGQSVAVVVWAEDSGVRIDWPNISLDVARVIQAKLQQTQKDDKPKELEHTRFPITPESVVRYQEEHPEMAIEPMADVAARLGVSRVIYVEIRSFQTRSESTVELFRGSANASINVVEVSNGKGHVAFTDDEMHISFPRTSPEEGLPNVGDFAMYHGTLDGLGTEVAKLFVPHADDPDAEYDVHEPTITPPSN